MAAQDHRQRAMLKYRMQATTGSGEHIPETAERPTHPGSRRFPSGSNAHITGVHGQWRKIQMGDAVPSP
jgi:hypothetical protein